MVIALNLLHARPEIGGVWNYIGNLLVAVAAADATNKYIAFIQNASEALVPDSPNFSKVAIPINSHSRVQRIVYENTLLRRQTIRHRVDCVHWFSSTAPVWRTVPNIVSVYDLGVFTVLKDDFSFLKRFVFSKMIRNAARRADFILPMSDRTEMELHKVLGVSFNRMRVIPAVLQDMFQPPSAERIEAFRSIHGLPEKFWLYVAQLYPHKNHLSLLRAFRKSRDRGCRGWKLVLRGGETGDARAEILRAIVDLRLQQDVVWFPRLKYEDLPLLYGAAAALIFPSRYEGGGIPVLEALGSGCPVLSSRLPSLVEYGGEAPVYFDSLDDNSICHTMCEFYSGGKRDRSRVKMGLERANEFRGPQIAHRLLMTYGKVVGRTADERDSRR